MPDIIWIVMLYLALQMTGVWVIYYYTNNPSVVDVSWSIGLMVSGLIYMSQSTAVGRMLLISVLLIIWAFRLAFHLWVTRIRLGHVDKRYLKLSENWTMRHSLGFFLNYQFQGFLILIISSVFYFAAQSASNALSYLDYLAIVMVLAGIIGESTADLQLERFKSSYPGKNCEAGLWQYSRHPNYFFDWVTWCGFTLFAFSSPYGCLALVSPLTLYIIFTRVTGPMTEQGSVRSRGDIYTAYQARVPMFFPWFKRSANSERKQ